MDKKEKKVYVCLGTCKAEISEKRYKNGLTKCGEKTCSKYNIPFEKRVFSVSSQRSRSKLVA